MGRPYEAHRYAWLSLEVSPRNPLSYVALGDAHYVLGDIVAAERNYESAIGLDATRLDGYRALADLYTAKQQHAAAIEVYQQMISRAPLDGAPWIALGKIYAEMGQYDEALAAFGRAAAMNPSDPDPWLRRGDVYLTQRDVAAAVAAFEHAQSVRPNGVEPLFRLANLFEQRGDLNKAEEYVRQALAIDSFSAAGYTTLGRILTAQGRNDAALPNYTTGLQLDPRQFGAYGAWIRLHIDRLGRYVIKDRLEAALAEIGSSPNTETLWAQVTLGLGYLRLEGASDQVVAHLERANALDPVYAELYRELALLYEQRGNGRVALAAWHRYLYATARRAPDIGTALAHIDWLLQRHIEQPADGARVSGRVEIVGTATEEGFQFYKLEYRSVGSLEEWIAIGEVVYQPVEHGQLMIWSTQDLIPGDYRLRLTVVDITGNSVPYDEITVRVESE